MWYITYMHTYFSHNPKRTQKFVEFVNIRKQDVTHFQKHKNMLDFNVVIN